MPFPYDFNPDDGNDQILAMAFDWELYAQEADDILVSSHADLAFESDNGLNDQPTPGNLHKSPAKSGITASPDQSERMRIYREIEDIDTEMREQELGVNFNPKSQSYLELKLRKTQFYIEKRNLPSAAVSSISRDKELVELELQHVVTDLELRELQNLYQLEPVDLEEDEAFLDLKLRKVRLRKELARLLKPPEKTAPGLVETGSLGSGLLSRILPLSAPQGQSFTNRASEAVETPSDTNYPTPVATEQDNALNDKIVKLMNLSTLKRPLADGVPENMLSILGENPEDLRARKKVKLSPQEIRNRQDVIARGGQCLNCKLSQSKPKCSGDEVCPLCKSKEGLECIRPTFTDKNVFAFGIEVPQEFGRVPKSTGKPTKAEVLQNFRDFFNFSAFPAMKQWPQALPSIDVLYAHIINLGFTSDVVSTRLRSLQSPCAFNVFIKTNTILKHFYLVLRTAKDGFEHQVRSKLIQKHQGSMALPPDIFEVKLQEKANKKLDDFSNYLKNLRAFSSLHTFTFLERVLRESNIRECRKPDHLLKRLSLLAIVGLTLEQVLEAAGEISNTMTIDPRKHQMFSHLGQLLLSHLQPPSILAFPPASLLNKCFGKDESLARVFIKDTFWFELYKESAKSVPPHLLFISEGGSIETIRPAQQEVIGADAKHNDQVEKLTGGYMRMNIRYNGSDKEAEQSTATPTIDLPVIRGNKTNDEVLFQRRVLLQTSVPLHLEESPDEENAVVQNAILQAIAHEKEQNDINIAIQESLHSSGVEKRKGKNSAVETLRRGKTAVTRLWGKK